MHLVLLTQVRSHRQLLEREVVLLPKMPSEIRSGNSVAFMADYSSRVLDDNLVYRKLFFVF